VIVLKLGGSLAEGDALPRFLAPLSRGGGRLVVVPGGGVFADAVRAEQRRHGFSDAAAHRMALLAMESYAAMLIDLAPHLNPCRTIGDMHEALGRGAVPLWLPSAMALAESSIAQSWKVTSDSLAAWLARLLEASILALAKSAPAPRPLDAQRLAADGMVDAEFPRYLAQSGAALEWLCPGDEDRLALLLAA
jgi:aspartokinase-like uncharacterized kinase